MRVLTYYSNKDVRLEEVPVPEIGPGEILLRVIASGICGSDVMEWYRSDKVPLVLGHEVGPRRVPDDELCPEGIAHDDGAVRHAYLDRLGRGGGRGLSRAGRRREEKRGHGQRDERPSGPQETGPRTARATHGSPASLNAAGRRRIRPRRASMITRI